MGSVKVDRSTHRIQSFGFSIGLSMGFAFVSCIVRLSICLVVSCSGVRKRPSGPRGRRMHPAFLLGCSGYGGDGVCILLFFRTSAR